MGTGPAKRGAAVWTVRRARRRTAHSGPRPARIGAYTLTRTTANRAGTPPSARRPRPVPLLRRHQRRPAWGHRRLRTVFDSIFHGAAVRDDVMTDVGSTLNDDW